MTHSPHLRTFTLTTLTLALLTACNSEDTIEQPTLPQGLGYQQQVPKPEISGATVVDGDIPVTNFKGNIVAYNEQVNPILQILSGFNAIWSVGDATWSSTGSNTAAIADGYETYTGISGGATNSTNLALQLHFGGETTLDSEIWHYNFDYVNTLTRPGQTSPDVDRSRQTEQVFAYLDDQRQKGFSITSGLGALANDYRTGANAHSPYSTNQDGTEVLVDGQPIDIFDANHLMNDDLGSGGSNYGQHGYELDNVVALLDIIRDFGASTEAPKYHFESPRPWRIEQDYSVASFSDINDVTQLDCHNLDGSSSAKFYDFPQQPLVSPIIGLRCAGRTLYTDNGDGSFSSNYSASDGDNWVSGRAKDGGFPSGHTTEAVDRGLGLAYAIPQRFAEMAARAVDLGTNRIVAGMHSPLDVIGGRIMGTAVTAAALNANPDVANSAVEQAYDYFFDKAQQQGFSDVNSYAHSDVSELEAQRYVDHDAMKARYRNALTYGFKPLAEPSVAPQVPKGAEILIASRFPYLDDAQRRAVLATTEIDSNYPVINQSRGWGRLDLVMAADGYGAFNGDVFVDMDANQGGFSARDEWRNDIRGQGLLTKRGSGQLTLSGDNSYQGGTIIEGGELVAGSTHALGDGTVYLQDGQLTIDNTSSGSAVTVADYVQQSGILALNVDNNASLQAENRIYLNGGSLQLRVPTLSAQTSYSILSARFLTGEFTSVSATDVQGNSYDVSVSYTDTGVTATITPQR
ncbi:phosphatase PAP2 family protein [Vibrio olivae]|uniref:Phosphatase PAP2 family protein n=1 Tax=Vibrio olivae TaxID=1243002 RepID=A0ABV5HK56_9VIBR